MTVRRAATKLPGPAWRVSLEELALGLRFLWRLPGCLRRPLSAEQSRAILASRLARRDADFLALARGAIYGQRESPYRWLLERAGGEYGDLERLVGQEGLDGALLRVYRDGAYLTIDELKGRRPVVRGSATLTVEPDQLHNPGAGFHLPTQSGGSRGGRTLVPVDLASVRDRAVHNCLALEARG